MIRNKTKKSVISIGLCLSLLFASFTAQDVYAQGKETIKTYLYSRDRVENWQCLVKDHVPVPYVAIDEYLNKAYTTYYSSEKLSDGTYRIANKRGEVIVDPAKDTLRFDAFEKFLYYDGRIEPGDTSQMKYEAGEEFTYVGDPKPLEMDLSAYHIDIIEEDGKVYLPLTTICDIASISYCSAVYYNGAISFNYSLQEPFVNWRGNLNNLSRSADEIAFTYNELCFAMDYLYVFPSRCELANVLQEKGFDKALQEYSSETRLVRDYLLSSDASRFVLGLTILTVMLDDGGHTYFDYITYNGNTPVIAAYKSILNNPDDPGTAVYNKWYSKKLARIARTSRIKNYLGGYAPYESMKVFDERSSDGNRFRYYEYDDTGIFVYDNYNERTVEYFKKALDQAKAHGMVNFVLDQSNNDGGYVDSAMYMVYAMTGEDSSFFEGPKTGNITVSKDYFDLDQDGEFEEDEDFHYSFNYAVICSAGSYSAGSNMPCIVKEYGVPILGETSSGGGCYWGEFKMTMGNLYKLASYATLKTRGGKSIEAGAEPDYPLDYSEIHDFKKIDEILDNHYAKRNFIKKCIYFFLSSTF